MNIKIVKGTCEHIKDCEEALLKSSLGEQYFSSEKSALKTIEEALDKGNLYVAITDNICVG
ncbi:MAG: GNAT family N-acetyltransferase, partial [Clostridiaceae bacterium]|nr:GNAT family N-acetyltransferase [Clostridiaceae bacterium]